MIKQKQKKEEEEEFKKLDISFVMSGFCLYNPPWACIMSWLDLNFRGKEYTCVVKSHGEHLIVGFTVMRFVQYGAIFIPNSRNCEFQDFKCLA